MAAGGVAVLPGLGAGGAGFGVPDGGAAASPRRTAIGELGTKIGSTQ
jgi:hypothetical protein